jgi:uroporphyrinogen-III decarboxylase
VTKKERVLRAIRREEVDRIPTTFRASKFLTISLMKHLGFEEPENFAKNQKEFLAKLGADFWSSGSKIDKFSTFLPTFTGEGPKPPYVDDGTYFYTIGIHARRGNMESFDIDYPNVGIDPPLADAESPSDIPGDFLTKRLDLFDFDRMKNKYRQVTPGELTGNDDDVVNLGTLSSLFMICCYLRGMEQFLMDMAVNPGLVERLVGEVCEFCLEFNRRELAAVGEQALYYGTWDDVAGQDGMLFSPALFKRYFLEPYRELIANTKKYGLLFGWHCCGSVHGVLPMMIDAGIDVFDVVQTSARDMEIENIYRLYGRDVCLHGGLDVQKLLNEKTPDEIRKEVRRIRDIWADRGGIVLAPSHETLPDTAVENVIAVYEAANA